MKNVMKQLSRIAVLGAALSAAACANVSLVPADKPVSVGNGVTVMPQRQWNQIKSDYVLWTAEGPSVDQIRFLTGIKSGSPLLPGTHDSIGVFDSKMLPNDIQDLVVGTVTKAGYQTVKPGNLTPCAFGSGQGFCFDLDFATPNGLQMKGLVMARKQADTLDVLLFEAPSEYYFGALSPVVSKMFASVQTK
jgi:hypothetical protein